MIDLSIIIINWNTADLLVDCLRSIENRVPDRLNLEIIVVDSASQDDSVAIVQRDFPHVTLLPQEENIGFVRGNNLGLEVAQGRYLFLLNPDTEVINDALTQMVDYLDAHPDTGIVGPHTLNTDRSYQSTRRHFPTVATGFFESTWLQPFAPKKMLDHYYVSNAPENAVIDVDWVQGSALMTRREVYEQIGGLDTAFVMFSEELDWCKRAKDVGWEVTYLGGAYITHHGGKSTEQVVANKHVYFQQSKIRYFRKHHGLLVALNLRLFLIVSYLWQIVLEGAKSLLGSKREIRRERIRAYWQVIRSGLKV